MVGFGEAFSPLGPALLATLQLALSVVASGHVILHKRDVRAAIGWLGLIWLVPLAGSILYALFGINRIRRRASGLKAHRPHLRQHPPADMRLEGVVPEPLGGGDLLVRSSPPPLPALARLMDRVAGTPLVTGNRITPLAGGRTAYSAMLRAIDSATRSLGLSTYIFDADASGRRFVDALAAAARRGVAVRVLIDGVGVRYSRPPVLPLLRQRSVTVAEFLPSLFPLSLHYANLRNHRKILVVDGRVGFTGGMNIRHGHCLEGGSDAIDDIHFELSGPVVSHLTDAFAEDWAFATGERLGGEDWFADQPAPEPELGPVTARGIAAGPDEAFERIRWAMLGALSEARQRLRIVTPYFLPDSTLSTALNLAALRGVALDIVLPAKSNLRLLQWASWAKLGRFLVSGCRVWLTPPPFDHSKLMTVDGSWSLIGSANWDPRSLRLNFEFNVEAYDPSLARKLDDLIDRRIASARPLKLDEVEKRSLAYSLRDGAAWLLSPYL